MKSIVPCQEDFVTAWEEYTNELDWNNVSCNESTKTQLKSCHRRLTNSIFFSKITNNISNIYRNATSTTKIPREKKLLFITSDDYVENLTHALGEIDTSGLSGYDVINPNSFFTGRSSINALLINLNKELIKKYDYLIVHLRDESDENINKRNATLHNFKSAILAGYMLAKYESYIKESIYLLKPTNTTRTFSDYSGYEYDSTSLNSRLEEIVNIIIS